MASPVPSDDLVALVYDGLLETTPFARFLEALRCRLDARTCSIMLQPPKVLLPAISFRVGSTARGRTRYWDSLYLRDPFVGLPLDTPVTFDAFTTEPGRKGQVDAGFMDAMATQRILGVDMRLAAGAEVRVRITRPRTAPDFNAADLALCGGLVPHLARALEIFLRLTAAQSQRQLHEGAVDQLAIGVATVAADGRVLTANPMARAILKEADGLALVADRLAVRDAAGAAALRAAIVRVASQDSRSAPLSATPLRLERPSGRPALAVTVRPAAQGDGLDGALSRHVVVMITDPARQSPGGRDALARLMGLTAAEGALAVLLAQGLSLYEAAEALGVARTTARAQLRSVFAKVGVNRQSELLRLILGYTLVTPA